ncbi:selenocysteine-specific translation elongation factor [bacterium]|nr:selenocysteine-specific translation elongation factor [bacterium]
MNHRVICTAGHIDHGKTALVKALTGMDTDRLREEIARGITIDLGFAYYNAETTIIDLPGHERFIRNMAAGAAAVDLALLVIAADDGPMPQTIEHLQILNLMGISRGIIVITKADLSGDDWLELVKEDIKSKIEGTFLEGGQVITVDSLSGRGIDELKNIIDGEIAGLPLRLSRPEFRMPVDRSFTIKGFGAVAAGTIISGAVNVKDKIILYPAEKEMKIRGIQIQGRTVERAETGARAALNLPGLEKSEIRRGDILAQPGLLDVSDKFDCRIALLSAAQSIKHRQRLRFHIGTAEIIGRILLLEDNILEPGNETYAQLELEQRTAALRGDRFVFRTYSPQVTIGGGVILMTAHEKRKRRQSGIFNLLECLNTGESRQIITGLLRTEMKKGMTIGSIQRLGGLTAESCREYIDSLLTDGVILKEKAGDDEWFILKSGLESLNEDIIRHIADYHQIHPAYPGVTSAQIKSEMQFGDSPFLEKALKNLTEKGALSKKDSFYSLFGHTIKLKPEQQKLADRILELVKTGGYSAPKAHPLSEQTGFDLDKILDMLAIMENLDLIVRLEKDTVIERDLFLKSIAKLKELQEEKSGITLQEAVKVLNSGRRFTVTLLEYLDRIGMTDREGDIRRFRR